MAERTDLWNKLIPGEEDEYQLIERDMGMIRVLHHMLDDLNRQTRNVAGMDTREIPSNIYTAAALEYAVSEYLAQRGPEEVYVVSQAQDKSDTDHLFGRLPVDLLEVEAVHRTMKGVREKYPEVSWEERGDGTWFGTEEKQKMDGIARYHYWLERMELNG